LLSGRFHLLSQTNEFTCRYRRCGTSVGRSILTGFVIPGHSYDDLTSRVSLSDTADSLVGFPVFVPRFNIREPRRFVPSLWMNSPPGLAQVD
jgi:hypothetical protein